MIIIKIATDVFLKNEKGNSSKYAKEVKHDYSAETVLLSKRLDLKGFSVTLYSSKFFYISITAIIWMVMQLANILKHPGCNNLCLSLYCCSLEKGVILLFCSNHTFSVIYLMRHLAFFLEFNMS